MHAVTRIFGMHIDVYPDKHWFDFVSYLKTQFLKNRELHKSCNG